MADFSLLSLGDDAVLCLVSSCQNSLLSLTGFKDLNPQPCLVSSINLTLVAFTTTLHTRFDSVKSEMAARRVGGVRGLYMLQNTHNTSETGNRYG